jgi:hypothetical protein
MTTGEHAHITLRRTGGLAGVPMDAALETSELVPDKAAEILDGLDRVDLAKVGKGEPRPGAADMFQYDLKVRRGEQTYTASFSDGQVPSELAPAVRELMDRASPGKRG